MSLLLAIQTPASPDATGTLAFTTGGIQFAGVGVETITGTASHTNGSITFAGVGVETETGTLAFTTGSISFAGVGVETETGTLAFTTGDITFSGVGNVATADVTGTLEFTTGSVQFAGQGVETEIGSLAVTTGSVTFSGQGAETETGTLAFTTDSIGFAGIGTVDEVTQIGGGGYFLHLDRIRRLKDKKKKELEAIDVYQDIIDVAPESVKIEAVRLIKPFTASKAKTPQVKSIDWAALEYERYRVNALLKLWEEQAQIDEEDDELMMLL